MPNGGDFDTLTIPGLGGTLTTPNNTVAILAPADAAGPQVNGFSTDAITITAIDQTSPIWAITAINTSNTFVDFVDNVRAGATQLFQGDLLVLTNANGSVFGSVTSVSMTSNRAFFADADPMKLNQPMASFGNLNSISNGDGTYPPTNATRISIVSYYIDKSVAANPKLMRAVNAQAPQIIVEQIENLQFTYDLFNFATNAASSNQANPAIPNQIRSVNVALSGRSADVLPRSKKYYRFSLASKVNVRNSTFRNRYTGS